MTERQKRFVDFYIQTGNAAEAAKKAGYSNKYANANARKILQNTTIRKAVEERLAELESARIADAEEVLRHLTAVMRGEIKEEVIVVEGSGDGYSSARVMTKQISEKDRLKAAELLAKRYGLLTEKVSLGDESGNEIKITVVKAVKSDAAT